MKKKIITLAALSAALLSVSSQAYSKELLICQGEMTDVEKVECLNQSGSWSNYNLFTLVRQGWSIKAIIPTRQTSHNSATILARRRIYLEK